jgi:hypothetical protein
MKVCIIFPAIALSLSAFVSSVSANCSGVDCLGSLGTPPLDITTQASCTQMGTESNPAAPANDSRWVQGLSTEVDYTVTGCDVVAHKIQWSQGTWSDWYMVGVNDLDMKYNTSDGTLRRMWAYFTDHNHLYIKCCAPDSNIQKTGLPAGLNLLLK